MPCRISALAIAGVATAVTVVAAQLAGPMAPPPREMNAYEVLDLGAPPAVACTCVPRPFARPSFSPGWRRATGPGASASDTPVSDADQQRNRAWDAAEERDIRVAMEQGLAGSSNASLAVALHLAQHPAIFGPDSRTEQETVRWLTLAAQQGHHDAYRLLAYRYAHGRGTAQDYAMAAYWFAQGARNDDPISMVAIGFLSAAGRGVPQDWGKAIAMWRRAGPRGPLATRYLGDAYACGMGVEQDPTRALALYRSGKDETALPLGHLYLTGCVPPDEAAAFAAFKAAADQGDPEAQIELSELYREGRGTEPVPYHAYLWARLAERRLPDGELKQRATERVRAAAQLMSAFERDDADRMVTALTSVDPVRR